MGRSGLTTQAIAPFDIALWDLKAKRADLPLAKLLGAHRDSVQCYNTSGGYALRDTHDVDSGTLADMLELADEALMYAHSVQADKHW